MIASRTNDDEQFQTQCLWNSRTTLFKSRAASNYGKRGDHINGAPIFTSAKNRIKIGRENKKQIKQIIKAPQKIPVLGRETRGKSFFGRGGYLNFRHSEFSHIYPRVRPSDGAQKVLPSGADLCRMVQRQPDTFLPVPECFTSQGSGRDETCGSFGMRLHTGTARRTATRPVLEETLGRVRNQRPSS